MHLSFESIILSRPDRIGDVIVSTACIAALKKRFPETQIVMVIDARLLPLMEGHPLLDHVIGLPLCTRAVFQERLERLFLNAGKSLLLELNTHPWVGNVAVRHKNVAWRRYKKGVFDIQGTVRDRRTAGCIHEALAVWDLLDGLNVPVPSPLSCVLPDYSDAWPALATNHRALTQPFAIFHLTAHGGKCSWPVAYFAHVASVLERSHGWQPVLVGVEDEPAQAFASHYAGVLPVINLTGKTSLRELGALLSRAQLIVSRDSGPAHLGAAVGCPTVALMVDHPKHCARRWAPLGARVAVVEQPLLGKKWSESRDAWWGRVFASIQVVDVLDAVERVAL
jgi:ADP-heptose:LPS heptosyltransferase